MGFGAHVSLEDLRERLRRQVALIQEIAGPELAPCCSSALRLFGDDGECRINKAS
jgi:hypothetical protein